MIIEDGIKQIGNISFKSEPLSKRVVDSPKNGSFEQFYDAALGVFNDTNLYEHQAEQAQLDFATGKNDNLLSVMMAQEKAHSSLNFTVQVTNKVIEAYREIMRIQM